MWQAVKEREREDLYGASLESRERCCSSCKVLYHWFGNSEQAEKIYNHNHDNNAAVTLWGQMK